MVEIAKADGAVELEGIALLVVVGCVAHRILIDALNITLLVISYYPNLDPLLQGLLLLLLLDLSEDDCLLFGFKLLSSDVLGGLDAINVDLTVHQAVSLGVVANVLSLLIEAVFYHLPIFLCLVPRPRVPFGIESRIQA